MFESLEVGVRLDIGLSPGRTGSAPQFFVNEITRWYEASFFSTDICAKPHDQLCTKFAASFSSWINSRML